MTRGEAQGLAEVFLVEAHRPAAPVFAVVSLNQEVGLGAIRALQTAGLYPGRWQPHGGSQAHHEGLVLCGARVAGDGRLDDVSRRFPWRWKAHAAVRETDRELGLGPRKGEAQLAFPHEHGAPWETLQDTLQLQVRERRWDHRWCQF